MNVLPRWTSACPYCLTFEVEATGEEYWCPRCDNKWCETEIPQLTHTDCPNHKCELCMDEHLKLGRYLDVLCGTKNRIDHLGKIHLWMSKNGKEPETEYGWASSETFEPENISAYVEAFSNDEV